MSTSRRLRCVLAGSRSSLPSASLSFLVPQRRCLHHSPSHNAAPPKAGKGNGENSSTALTPSVIPPSASAARLQKVVKGLRGYNKADRLELEKKYTPAQLAALEAGEAAISPHDIAKQGAIRRDRMGINYIDDFATIRPYIDKPIRAPEKNYDPNLRFKEDDEIAEDLTNWAENLPENPTRLDWLKFADNVRVTVGKEEAELNAQDSLAPELPKMTDAWMVASAKAAAEAAGDEKEHDADLRLLAKRTGRPFRELKRIRLKTLVQRRVVNQTRLGKVQSQYYLTVAGNGRGLLGIGEGKSAEMLDGKRQSLLNAIRNMRPIKRYEERTIYGDVKGKVGATELVLMTRPPGFGIRCQDKIHEICKCAGISDLAARVTRSRNPMNIVKATMQALLSQRIPEDVARGRGRKLVDVRKVYYGGHVY